MAAVIIRNESGEVLIEKRPETGLLARLWQFPNIETTSLANQAQELEAVLKEDFQIEGKVGNPVQTVEHVFSHLIWHITVYEVTVKRRPNVESETRKWVKRNEVEQFAFPVSHQKIIQQSL